MWTHWCFWLRNSFTEVLQSDLLVVPFFKTEIVGEPVPYRTSERPLSASQHGGDRVGDLKGGRTEVVRGFGRCSLGTSKTESRSRWLVSRRHGRGIKSWRHLEDIQTFQGAHFRAHREQLVDEFKEKAIEVARLNPQERVQRRVAGHIVAVPGPQSLKENAEVANYVLHE